SVAALARVFSEYFAQVVPISPVLQTSVAVVVIAIVTAVNVWGTRKSSDLQNWTTVVKVGVIVVLSTVLLTLGHHAKDLVPAMAAYLFALGPVATAASDTIAAASVSAVLGSWAGKIVALTILVSTFSAANSVILTAPRVFYAMAQDNLFFGKLAVVHAVYRTPVFAIVALGAWSAVLVCAGQLGQFQKLIEGVIFIGWIFYGLGAAAIFPIRRASGGQPR